MRCSRVLGLLLLGERTAASQLGCQDAIAALLSPANLQGLAIANDASSGFNVDAYDVLSKTTGYPGEIGDYGECSKVAKLSGMETHLCLSGSIDLRSLQGLPPFGAACVPIQCLPHDLQTSNLTLSLLTDESLNLHSPTAEPSAVAYVKKLRDMMIVSRREMKGFTCGSYRKPKVGTDAWCMIILISVLLVCVIGATYMDMIKGPDYPERLPGDPPGDGQQYERVEAYGGDLAHVGEDHISKRLAAFSIPRNLKRLFDAGERNELSAFHGMRVISMMWVVLGHILAVQASLGYTDPEAVFPPHGLVAQYVGQLFFSARFAVDTFFFVSGFLVVYVMLRRYGGDVEVVHEGNRSGEGIVNGRASSAASRMPPLREWLPLFYMHRILRISPPYIFTLLFWWKLAVFLGDGPFWYRWKFFIGLCDRFWWSNLLYVNNLVPWHMGETMECFYHTWYLANDMQFYLVSPIFIVLYLRNKLVGATAVFLLLLVTISAMMWGTFVRKWSSMTLDGAWVVRYSQEAYTTPWFRITPYLFGMLFAMLWDEKKRRWPHFRLTNRQRHLMLSIGITLLFVVTFSGHSGYGARPCSLTENPHKEDCGSMWPLWKLSIYNAFCRPAWVLGLSLICFVCFNNQGGLIQQLLEHRAWVPLSRLTFSAYLVHPILINLWFLNTTSKFHFSKLDFVMIYVSICTATFASSLVLALLLESPLTVLSREAEKRAGRSEKSIKALDMSNPGMSEGTHLTRRPKGTPYGT